MQWKLIDSLTTFFFFLLVRQHYRPIFEFGTRSNIITTAVYAAAKLFKIYIRQSVQGKSENLLNLIGNVQNCKNLSCWNSINLITFNSITISISPTSRVCNSEFDYQRFCLPAFIHTLVSFLYNKSEHTVDKDRKPTPTYIKSWTIVNRLEQHQFIWDYNFPPQMNELRFLLAEHK